jgi:hypothetical protein
MPKSVGTAKNPGANKNHAKGFEDALENALFNISKGDDPFTTGPHDVTVVFSATITVENPARVDSYIATVEAI